MPLTERFTARVQLAAPPDEVFAWHDAPGAFEALAEPGSGIKVLERRGGIRSGDRVRVSVPVLGPLRLTWTAVHDRFTPGQLFTDRTEGGPFAVWHHLHRFDPDGQGGTWMDDTIEWRLRGGDLVHAVGARVVRPQLERMFAYRHSVLRARFGFGGQAATG
jgi:ligand-binding SRPBCC domain-containing protein